MYGRRKLLKTAIYDILYHLNKEIHKESCSSYSLTRYIADIQQRNGEISFIYRRQENKKPKKIDPNKIEKNKYYNSKYSSFYKKYKSEKISKEKFDEVIKVLKHLKLECNTKNEFETQFEEYKKNTNNIP